MIKESEVMNNKNTYAYMQAAVNVIFTQIHAKKRINIFGERDILAMVKKFKKKWYEGVIPEKPVVIPLNTDELTDAERRQVLEAASLIKEKRNGIIKGRTWENGSNQKRYFKERDSFGITNGIARGIIHHASD